MYKRWIDDIFCIYGNEKDEENSFEFLNCCHKIQNSLLKKKAINICHFLIGILSKNEGNRFSTSIYRKKKSIELFTQFNSSIPLSYKIGLARCLIHRAFKISSSYIILHNELEKIKISLQKNMYPKSVIDNQNKTFLEKQFTVDMVQLLKNKKHYIIAYHILDIFLM